MKRSLLILIMVLTLASCVTNNGYIGRWYGVWALDRVTVDGVEDTSWRAPGEWVNWSFQNNIVDIVRCNSLNDDEECYGTWAEKDGTLVLDYGHSDNESAPGTGVYAPPVWLHIDSGVTVLRIENATGRTVTLAHTDSHGHRVVYTLRKTY